MPSTHCRSILGVLCLAIIGTACPPFDKNDDQSTSGDGDTSDDGGTTNGLDPALRGHPTDGGSNTTAAGNSGAGAAAGQSAGSAGNGQGANGGQSSGSSGDGAGAGAASGAGSSDPWAGGGAAGGGSDPNDGDPFGTGDNAGGGSGMGADPFGADDPDGGIAGDAAPGVGTGTFNVPGVDAGGAGDDPNVPLAARLSNWSGRWDGQMNYQVFVGVETDFLGGDEHPIFETHQMPMALRIDAIDYDGATAHAAITARVAVGDCLLSADLQADVFFGDALSPLSSPLLSVQAAGANAMGQFLAMRASAQRIFGAITGTLNFQGVDALPAPCSQKDLPFQITRTFAK